MGNGDVTTDVSPQDGGHGQPVQAPPDLPLDFEAFSWDTRSSSTTSRRSTWAAAGSPNKSSTTSS